MEDEDDANFICSLLEQAAQEARQENEAENSNTSQSQLSLSTEIIQKLSDILGGSSSQCTVDGTLWEALSQRRVPLGDLVNGLVGTMERGGTTGVQAANVYLLLLLAPESPSYSLFSPFAFQVLLRCVLNACKSTGAPTVEFKAGSSNRKKSQKKGKRVRDIEDRNEEDSSEPAMSGVAVEDITLLLSRLRAALQVISLREHQGTLKTLLEFLAELPHVVADMQEPSTEERGHKLRKGCSLKGGPDSNQNTRLVFCLLEDMLDLTHGEGALTAVLVLKLLTPSLLLMRNSQQKSNIRIAAIELVVKCMLGKGDEGIHTAVVALTRYLCFKAPEKTDARTQAVETILILVKALSTAEQHSFGKFVCKLSRGKARYRLLALDLCAALFAQMSDPLGLEETDAANGESDCRWGIACLEAILQRCSDKVPTIRARALGTLAQVIELLSAQVRQRMYLQELFAALGTTTAGTSTEGNTSWDTPFRDIVAMGSKNLFTVSGARNSTPAVLSPGAHRGDFGSLMRKRCSDDKAAVRKAALVLMTKSTIALGNSPDDQMLQAVGFSCSDQMLSIRKAALSALSEVTRRFSGSKKVVTEWLQSALPLAIDNESSIQEETVSHFKELCLDPITSISVLKVSSKQLASTLLEKSDEPEQQPLPPGVLHFLTGLAEDSDSTLFIKRVCARLGKTKGLRGSVITALQNIITASEELLRKKRHVSDHKRVESISQGAWFLLSELSCFLPKVVSWDFLRTHWQLLGKQQGPSRLDEACTPVPYSSCTKRQYQESASWAASRVHLLQTVANVAVELPPDAAVDLADELLKNLEDFNMHPAEVGAHVSALTILCKRKAATGEEGEELVAEWVKQLLHKAEAILKKHLSKEKDDGFQTPGHVSSRRSNLRKKAMENITTSQVVTAIFTIGATVLVCPFSNTDGIVILLERLIKVKEEPAVNAQTWVTLGKLCLADDKLAKRLIPVFVQELETTSSAAMRNNIVITLTDFCVRYTALIEGYIPKLTKSLRDACEIVRRQTFVLLARLLQRDYVKWRGMLFHRFLLALVDESPKICQMADFLFGNILKTKAPLLAYNSFVEAIFVLNDYQGQSSGSNVLHSSESERHLFSLRGSSQAAVNNRMHIYITLLKQMSPEHLLATSAKLCAEILAGAADGLIDITSSSGKCVIEDALKILASKEMRLAANKTASNTAEQMEEEDGAAAFAAMKGKVVTQFAKKNLVQNAIPIFIELKRLLEKGSSPLLGVLMECLRNMLKDYKSEIEEILVGDKQLQKELMYDMQKHETVKARSKMESLAARVGEPNEKQAEDGNESKAGGRKAPSAIKKKAVETTARVTWLDQTPRLRGVCGTFTSPKGPSRNGGVLSPRFLVGAAGDMAAAATAASVLQDAAAGKTTPLRAMSLPRLRRGVHAPQDHTENEGVDSARRRLDR